VRDWVKAWKIAPCLLLLLCTAAIGQGPAEIRFTTTRLGDNVALVASGAGGNLAACFGEDGVFLVDAEYAELVEKTQAAVATLSDQPIRWVLNTHWHFDHTGGNAHFAAIGAVIAAHETVRERMSAGQHLAVIDVDVPPSPPAALPTLTFRDGATFHVNGEEIRVFHAPAAHTDGDLIVHFRNANVVHVGDLVFNRGYPFIDVVAGGTIDGMVAGIERALTICDDETKIIPGHGPLSNKAELAEYAAMLRSFRDAIAQEIAAGKNLTEVLDAKPTAALDEKWGSAQFPPPLFTEMVYLSLGGE
jgi:cyclase